MKIEHTQVFGFESAIRGMRNPLDSWHLSDSFRVDCCSGEPLGNKGFEEYLKTETIYAQNIEGFVLGAEDMKLSQKLTKNGSEHCKHLRMIGVWVDLTLPRFIWSEFDTYHFNTKNSCSTMHTIHRRELTQDDFEYPLNPIVLEQLNALIIKNQRKDADTQGNRFIREIKNALPDGYLQKRTVFTNYAELYSMLLQRDGHRLEQWNPYICDWIVKLPFFPELTGYKSKKNND